MADKYSDRQAEKADYSKIIKGLLNSSWSGKCRGYPIDRVSDFVSNAVGWKRAIDLPEIYKIIDVLVGLKVLSISNNKGTYYYWLNSSKCYDCV